MDFHCPIYFMKTTPLSATSATPCASQDVLDGTRNGRHTIEITGVEKVYIGDKDVTASTGRPIAAGETVRIPVHDQVKIPCYVIGGSCILSEYF